MKASRDAGDCDGMLAAARLNWRLWTIIQSELLDPTSMMPSEVRVNVLSLARFVDATTIDFVADPLAAKLDPLIAINRELASGLYTNPDATVRAVADNASLRVGESDPAMSPERPVQGSIRLTI
jgi:flagellar protein FlaF